MEKWCFVSSKTLFKSHGDYECVLVALTDPVTLYTFYLHDCPKAEGADGVTDPVADENIANVGNSPAAGNETLECQEARVNQYSIYLMQRPNIT